MCGNGKAYGVEKSKVRYWISGVCILTEPNCLKAMVCCKNLPVMGQNIENYGSKLK